MKIVKARPKDATAITELCMRSKAFWNYTSEQIESWREDLTITEEYIIQNGVYKLLDYELMGFYAFEKTDEPLIKLNFLFVDPSQIGKGYGKILLEHFLERAKESGYQAVTLDADPNAEAFYRKQGFQVVGQLPSSIKNRFLPIMRLEL